MTNDVQLREVTEADLSIFFEQQRDPEANHRAAFTVEDPTDEAAFTARWSKILADSRITKKTILFAGHVVGHVVSFERLGKPEVSYWIGKEYWGKGIATKALSEFLRQFEVRPLYARAASDNVASIRVLEKCGFEVSGYERAYANARGEEIEEAVLALAGTQASNGSTNAGADHGL